MKLFIYTINAVLLALIPLAASIAGTTLQMRDSTTKNLQTIQVQDGFVRMDEAQSANYILYDHRNKQLLSINAAREEYFEFDEQLLESQANTLQTAMQGMTQQMQAAMKNMNPQQRQMLAEKMKSMGMALPAEQAQTQTEPGAQAMEPGKQDKVNGINCRRLEIQQEGEKKYEACVASQQDLKIPEQDYQAISGMMKLMSKLSTAMPNVNKKQPMLPENIAGIGIRFRDFERNSETSLASIQQGKLSQKLFTQHKDYAKRDFRKLMGMGIPAK